MYSARDGKKLRRSFRTQAEARGWRSDVGAAVRKGKLRAASAVTLGDAFVAFVAGAREGAIHARDGRPYKASVVNDYDRGLQRLVDRFGPGTKLAAISRLDLQDYVDELVAQGLSGSSCRNLLMGFRAVCRRALERGELHVNPCDHLRLPAPSRRRERVADPEEAVTLLEALPGDVRGIYATAFLAGLRAGEIAALDWTDVNLGAGRIMVRRAWDFKTRTFVEPKTAAGKRTIPIVGPLHDELAEHRARSGRDAGLVFGDGKRPFVLSTVHRRAKDAWEAAGLDGIGLHEGRHSAVTLWAESGVALTRISRWAGHADEAFTLRQYAKAFESRDEEEATKVGATWDAALAETAATPTHVDVVP